MPTGRSEGNLADKRRARSPLESANRPGQGPHPSAREHPSCGSLVRPTAAPRLLEAGARREGPARSAPVTGAVGAGPARKVREASMRRRAVRNRGSPGALADAGLLVPRRKSPSRRAQGYPEPPPETSSLFVPLPLCLSSGVDLCINGRGDGVAARGSGGAGDGARDG